ncbi:TonB-dependent receptor family protein [Mucilaginibacter sp. 21P]|uniref:outer membrane beta-barrel family protein n=1 Tax=Mucilaginibacter sp. 21P TaxID=2778902 RepID=UPI001C5A3D3A|nr:outer membrane beta-barrel family protein [Mucilaginibacter sp. 21P]QXV63902.1 TonB-dependent receptor family protein [Mucilaginibacter sp. 21P]
MKNITQKKVSGVFTINELNTLCRRYICTGLIVSLTLLAGDVAYGKDRARMACRRLPNPVRLLKGESRIIAGAVLDAQNKSPIGFATVEIMRRADNKIIAQASTDTSGRYHITVENIELILRVRLVGYQPFSMSIDPGNSAVDIPAIYLRADKHQLNEVTVSASVPLVRQQVDRLSYNVQSDPESKINSVMDMLRKVPLLSVDADDNVKLKGSSSYKILIDGKESSLVASNPKDVFRSMSASNILRIEVITTPPAKYSSEGLAGIINIITIKKTNDGYNGNVGVSYKYPNGPRGNGAISYKSGKFGLSAYGGASEYNTPQTNFSITQNGFVDPVTRVSQHGSAQTHSNLEYVSTQLSFEADSLNLFTASMGYNHNHNHKEAGASIFQSINAANQSYDLRNDGRGRGEGYDLGLDYQLGFKRSKAQLLILSYKFSHNSNNLFNALTTFNAVNYNSPDYNQANNSGVNEHTIQADYTHPVRKLTIDFGVKAILRKNFSDYEVSDRDSVLGIFILNPGASNQFTYQQNIYAIYNSYLLNLKKWTFQLGLRGERTNVNADFSNSPAKIPNYDNFIPSFSVQNKISGSSSINFGYTERILRPGITQLNPFVDRQNPLFITVGNPNLKAELNHIINLSYGVYKAYSINFGLSYTFSNNSIQYISHLGDDGVTRSTFENLGKNKNLEADVNANWQIGNRVNINLNGQLSRVWLTGAVDSALYSRSAFVGNANVYVGYKFGHDWRSGFNFMYFSPAITLQGTSSPYYYSSISLSKNITKNFNISGSISNPYQRYLSYDNKTVDPRFVQMTTNQIVYRRFNIGVNYKFGKLKDGSIKRNKKGIDNNDIKIVPSSLPGN